MADDLTLPASGAVVATDEADFGGGLAHAQILKLADGTEGSAELLPGSAARGLAVEPRANVLRLAQTPTISTSVYAAKDAIGGLLTFAGAARAAGRSCWLEAVQVVDKDQQLTPIDLVLFDRAPTAPTDNAVFAPTDAEIATIVGVVQIQTNDYRDFSTNAVAVRSALGLPIVLNGTDLYGVLVARSTPTYASTSSLVVTATIARD